MSTSKKIFLLVFGLVIIGLNFVIYTWSHSLSLEEVNYLNTNDRPLAFDDNGRIWVDSRNKGETQLRVYQDGQLIQTYTENDSPAIGINIDDFVIDNNGRIWITRITGTSGRTDLLAMFNGEQWNYPIPEAVSSLDNFGISAFAVDHLGRAWIGVPNHGLYIIDGATWENYNSKNSDLINNTVWHITFDNQGRAWIATFPRYEAKDGGINVFDGKDWQTYTPGNSPLLSDQINTIAFDSQNRAWIGTIDGISIFDGEDWTSYSTQSREFTSPKNFNRGIDTLTFDGQGRAWVSRTRVFDEKKWEYYFDPYHLQVEDIIADDNGNIWVHTFGQGTVIVRSDSPQPVPYETGALSFILSRAMPYITILLLIILASVGLNAWGSIGVGLLGFPIYVLWINNTISNGSMEYYERYVWNAGDFLIQNPAFYATVLGIIGGSIEVNQERNRIPKTRRWGAIGFLAGIALSFCAIILPQMFMQ